MPNLNDMVNEVRSNLQGYTLRQDRLTYLANAGGITASGTEIQVGSSSNLAKGIIEIDDELIWVDSFNKATGVSSSSISSNPNSFLAWLRSMIPAVNNA